MVSKATITAVVTTAAAVLLALFIANMVNKQVDNAPLRP